jgi:eukaryotic-like serine/threonine-protein kinase
MDCDLRVNVQKGYDAVTRSRIGPLALESPLGERGSSIYRAVHMQQKTQVVVRVFSQPMGMTPEAKQEFASQLDSLKAIRHPHIVRCYGGGFDAKDAYLVYEDVDGESLDKVLARKERLPWEMVLDFGLQLCDALQYAHQSSWIHGRIRPDKVIVTDNETKVKLSDFRRSSGMTAPPTAEQLAYSAPETFADKPKIEVASDLYSVGAVLYHALTGHPPFTAGNPTLMRHAISDNVVPPVASIVFDCPVWLSTIVEQLLNKDPLKRPYTANAASMAFREAQRRACEGISVAEHAMSGFSPLQLNTNRDEVEKALGKKKKKKRLDLDDDNGAPSLLERPMVLASILLAAVGLITYLVWPLGEKTMRDRAERLMASDELGQMNDARDKYLYAILERFPNGSTAEWAQTQLDEIEMRNAEFKIQNNRRFGREPSSEGERKYSEANRYELFGDRVTALEQYQGIVSLLKDEEKERPFVNLARRQIAKIQSNPPSVDELRKFLKDKLDQADKMMGKGDVVGAKQIWDGIVNLYNGNKEMLPIVEQAQARLSKLKG